MKILLLHQHFKTPESGGAIRSYYLATALAQAGHEVVVITGGDARQQVEREGFRIYYLAVPYHNRFGFAARMLSFARFAWRAYRQALREPAVDFVYAISVPLTVGWIALGLKKKRGYPFLFEVGDLWPEAPIQLGFLRNRWLQRWAYRMEKRLYQEAEKIVALSPMIRDSIARQTDPSKIYLVPNMADTEFYFPQAKPPLLQKAFATEGKVVITYAGALGYANGLDFIIEAARACRHRSNWLFVMAGDGALRSHLESRIATEQLENVRLLPFTNRQGVADLLAVTDICLISYRPVPVLETGSPNKYFDALAAGKPVVVNFKGWIREEIERAQCGVFVDAAIPADAEAAVEKILQHYARFADAARQLAERSYSRQRLTQAWVALFPESAPGRH